jgi:hypothetical protein
MPTKSTLYILESRDLILIRPKLSALALITHVFIIASSFFLLFWMDDIDAKYWWVNLIIVLLAIYNIAHFIALLLRNIQIAMPSRLVTMYNPFCHTFLLSDIKDLKEIEYSDSENDTFRLDLKLENGKRIRLETVSPAQTKELKMAIQKYMTRPDSFHIEIITQ